MVKRSGCNITEDHLSIYQSSDDYDDPAFPTVNVLRKRDKPEWILLNRFGKKTTLLKYDQNILKKFEIIIKDIAGTLFPHRSYRTTRLKK